MGPNHNPRHLTSEQIQEFLDRHLSPEEEASVQEHLSVCPLCQSEVEGWSLLFSDLSQLRELQPGPAFLQEVIQEAPIRQPVGDRSRGWLAARKARRREDSHIPAGSLQDYLEGLLPTQPAARLEAHLATCQPCSKELKGWSTLVGSFEPLGHFAPSPGFAQRVMAEVMVPTPVAISTGGWSSLPGRALAWARSFFPKTRHGWAVAGGVASAPTITLATLFYFVFSRPLVTAGNLGSYVLWKGSVLFDILASSVADLVRESSILSQITAILEPVAHSPLLIGLGGLVFSLLSASALWVLYRNLILPPSENRYARSRV